MTQERLTLRKIREILRLEDAGLSKRRLSILPGTASSSARSTRRSGARTAGRGHGNRKERLVKNNPGWASVNIVQSFLS
jgi:hypothetical protein